jgi:hypothetical protein
VAALTKEAAAARDGRLIETYADKEEVVVLFARTLDGRAHIAGAPLHRRSHSGRIAGYGAWRGLPGTGEGPTRVQAVLLEHFFRAYLEGIVGGAAG